MKHFFLCCLFLLYANTSVASDNTDDWQKAINDHVAFITKNCRQTHAYKRYDLAKNIERDYDTIQTSQSRLKHMKSAKEKSLAEIDRLQAQKKHIENTMLKDYARYRRLGGKLALPNVKPLSDPCEESIRAELSKLSYVLPIEARYRHRVRPSYPRKEAVRGQTGRVEFEFVIDTQGKAKHINTITATTTGFEKYARKALKASTFYVYMRHGKAYEHKAKTTFLFILESATSEDK